MYQKGEKYYYTPDELGYQDRGMMKWQGFLLSNHSEMMEEEAAKQAYKPDKMRQNEQDKAAFLAAAYQKKQKAAIQLDCLEDGRLQEELEGYLAGMEAGIVFLETESGLHGISLELIRSVRLDDSGKWFRPH